MLIQSAYQVREFQVLGGPAWIDSDRYDINAKVKGNPTRDEWSQAIGPMEQSLLRERFKLRLHRETRDLPVYSLTVAKDGLKLHPTRSGGCTKFERSRYPISSDQRWSPDYCGAVETGPNIRLNHTLDAVGMSISEGPDSLVPVLEWQLDHRIIDHTGLSGIFDIRLEWNRAATAKAISSGTHGDASPRIPLFDDESPSIFAALEEQLGLKLESAVGPIEVLVIDHAEHPLQ
jgi:uncharacterized protein (TIGR03435 family)